MKTPALLLITALPACGAHHAHTSDEAEGFTCRDRFVSYVAALGGGAEHGVAMDCKDAGPRIKRWRVRRDGHRDEDTRSIEPGAFEKVWAQVDGTGWPNMHDCDNGTRDKGDPVYTFVVVDDQNKATFKCETREVPYPYHDLTDPLDLTANQGQPQLGDDEPAEAKALDAKDKQK
jgi:hypothetical protein